MPNIFGTNGDDSVSGTAGADNIFLSAGSDVVAAGDGDDLILVDPGVGSSSLASDTLDGGTGFDTVALSGTMADYTTSFNLAGHLVLTGTGAYAGNTETLIDIESVVFDDYVMRIVDASGTSGALTTIQSAVDQSAAGDSVVVLAGTYNEAITVTKALSFIGQSAADVTVSGSAYGFEISGDIDNGGTETVSIDGFTVSANSVGVKVASGTNLSNLSVSNSAFSGNATHGVSVGTGTPDLDNVTITDSTFSDIGTGGSNGSGAIVLFGYTGDATITGVSITSLGNFGAPTGGLPDNAIQIAGFDQTTYDVTDPIGTVVLDDITITGAFHKPPLAIQGFTNLSTLTLGTISITGSSTWGTLVFIDQIASTGTDSLGAGGYPGNFAGTGGTNTIDLSGITLVNLGTSDVDAYVRGTDANDIITGTSANDVLNDVAEGGHDFGGDDLVSGGAGDDVLVGGIGNDTLDGGTGNDTVKIFGNREDYSITQNEDGTYTVTDISGPIVIEDEALSPPPSDGGTDAVSGVEVIEFDDGVVELSANAPDYSGALERFSESFENGYGDDALFTGGYGVVTIVASGTGGIAATDGGNFAMFENDPTLETGPFTRFDGYRTGLEGGFTASFDVYLDAATMAVGEGFDVSVGGSSQAGAHFRDFVMHVTHDTDTGSILVGGSNNSSITGPIQNLEAGNHAELSTAGWYSFEWQFYENDLGDVEVAMNVYDAAGDWVFTEVRSTGADDWDTVYGGNRYMWFPFIDVDGGIAVDNISMSTLDTNPVQLLNGSTIVDSFATIAAAVAAAGVLAAPEVDVPELTITLAAGDYIGEGLVSVDVEGLTISGPADAVNVSLQLAVGISGITLGGESGISVIGNNDANTITGNDGDNTLFGNLGNDMLVGGDGDDALFGGNDNDTLIGGDGNDSMFGDLGADSMIGGDGNDVYYVDDIGDEVIEGPLLPGDALADPLEGGNDTVITTLTTYRLADNVENAIYNGTGAYLLKGNSGDNLLDATLDEFGGILRGFGGDDTLLGGTGNDTLNGGNGVDQLNGGAGNDRYVYTGNDAITDSDGNHDIVASIGHDVDLTDFVGVDDIVLKGSADLSATGDAENNIILGNDGNNEITGGGGADKLEGGAGLDVFIYNDVTDSQGLNKDVIRDFEQGTEFADGDLISLLAIDAVEGGRNSAFSFIGTDSFSGTAGELRYRFDGVNTVVQGDTNGDGIADLAIKLRGDFALEDADFIL